MGRVYILMCDIFKEIDYQLALALLYTTDKRSIRIHMSRKLFWSLENIEPVDFCRNEPPTYRGYPIEFDEYLPKGGITISYAKEEYNEG